MCAKVASLNQHNCACLAKLERREWPVSQLEDRIIGQFEDEVRRRRIKTYQATRRVDAAEAERMENQFQADMDANAYNWEDLGANQVNHVKAALKRTWGAAFIVYLLLHRCDESVDERTALDIWNANPVDAMRTWLWASGLSLDPNVLSSVLAEATGVEVKPEQQPTPPMTRQQQLEAELEQLKKTTSQAQTTHQSTGASRSASGGSTSGSSAGPTTEAEATFPS